MREIKFRYYWQHDTTGEIKSNEFTLSELEQGQFSKPDFTIRWDSLGCAQFTGLQDKNGKEIYEGDIVKCIDHPTNTENVTNEVYFKDGAFRVKWSMVQLGEFGTAWIEVIGNICEHPELLTTHAPKD